MAGNLPSRRIDREALERIIQRAAELQAGELDTGESMTEAELLKLGADVGIDGRFLRQAMYEQSAGLSLQEKGLLARWFGPAQVGASRVVAGDATQINDALAQWMDEGEALSVKRRMADRTVWERRKGFFAEMKRGFGVGGKSYHLARAQDVTAVVTRLESGYCHVELVADVSHQRGNALAGSVIGGVAIAMTGVILLAISSQPGLLLDLVAAVPIAGGATIPYITGRAQKRHNEQIQLALEQVLDRLEHGEIKPRHLSRDDSPFGFIEDIRRAILEGVETGHPKRLPPRR